MTTKEHIIDEIKRVADKIGRAPGRSVFEKETGIRMPEWYGVHWRSWGEALKDAGYQPNKKQAKLSSDEVLRKYAEAVRHFQKIPADIDIRMYGRDHADFPGHSTFNNHFGNKEGRLAALSKLAHSDDEFSDLIPFLPEPGETEASRSKETVREGHVYLLKSGDHYKIGRSDELEKRVKQISIALPEEVTLVHSIRTDDPPGIEAYWHRRFAERRANGEWFRLTTADVRAFKRRKYQ